jgi:hypothetical protein
MSVHPGHRESFLEDSETFSANPKDLWVPVCIIDADTSSLKLQLSGGLSQHCQ